MFIKGCQLRIVRGKYFSFVCSSLSKNVDRVHNFQVCCMVEQSSDCGGWVELNSLAFMPTADENQFRVSCQWITRHGEWQLRGWIRGISTDVRLGVAGWTRSVDWHKVVNMDKVEWRVSECEWILAFCLHFV